VAWRRGVAERRLARQLQPLRDVPAVHVGPGLRLVAIDLDDFGLDVRGQQALRRVGRDQRAVIDDREPGCQPLGLVHEVRRQQDCLALRQQLAQPVPDQMACLRVEAGRRLVEDQKLGIVDQRTRQRQPALHAP
jgi:hypothetical protein